MKLFRKIWLILNAILVAVSLFAFLSPYINPESIWFFSFPGLFFPILMILNAFFVLSWWLIDWKHSWMSIIILMGGIFLSPYILSFKGTESVNEYHFSVASYNMNYAYGTFPEGSQQYDNKSIAVFKSFLTDTLNPDILCGQEINGFLEKLLKSHYPYIASSSNIRTTIYSKFPVIQKGTIDFGGITNSCVWADLLVKNDTIRVYSAHFQSNNITKDTDLVIEDVENRQSFKFFRIRSILTKYKTNVIIRAGQARKVREHIDNCPHPIIMGVDLNDPPISYTHRKFSGVLQDAFAVQGKGFSSSYAGKIPLLRIDNLFFSDDFDIRSYKVFRKRYSDHYPVKSEVDLIPVKK